MSESDRPERRGAPRHDLVARVAIKQGAMEHVLDVVNVSRTGVLINLEAGRRPMWLEIERRLKMVLTPSGGDPIRMEGVVVRIVEDRRFRAFAVEFASLDPSAREKIDSIVQDAGKKPVPPPLPR